jgi:hypothetical protein
MSRRIQSYSSGSPPGRRAAQISKSNQHNVLAPLGRAKGVFLPFGLCNGLFSAGFPTGAQGVHPTLPHPDPTNQLPTSLYGQAQQATGRLHCSYCNFSRVAQATPFLQATTLYNRRKQLTENSNPTAETQAATPVGKPLLLWESRCTRPLNYRDNLSALRSRHACIRLNPAPHRAQRLPGHPPALPPAASILHVHHRPLEFPSPIRAQHA